jgi:hypothetical protein
MEARSAKPHYDEVAKTKNELGDSQVNEWVMILDMAGYLCFQELSQQRRKDLQSILAVAIIGVLSTAESQETDSVREVILGSQLVDSYHHAGIRKRMKYPARSVKVENFIQKVLSQAGKKRKIKQEDKTTTTEEVVTTVQGIA